MADLTYDEAGAQTALERASAKVRRHLLPFLIVCYFGAYLDRVNVGFAALTMNADLGIGPEAFGFTAGIFFLGYCLFEVPSNILLEKCLVKADRCINLCQQCNAEQFLQVAFSSIFSLFDSV